MENVAGVECHKYNTPLFAPYSQHPHGSGPIQWARGDVGLKPSAAARPSLWALVDCEWRAAAPGLKPLHIPRAWSPGMGEGGNWWAGRCVSRLIRRGFPGSARVYPPLHPCDTHHQS